LRDATDMTRVMQNDIVANQLREQAAKAQSPLAVARANEALGKLHMDSSQMLGQMAMRKTLLSAAGQGDMSDPKNMGQYLQAMRLYNPEMAKDIESRAIPGIGIATTPVPPSDKQAMVSRIDLHNKLHNLLTFAESHSGSLSPADIATGGVLARVAQDAYRQGNDQGVFKKSEKDFVNESISDNPTQFFNKFRGAIPAYKASIQANLDTLQNMASHYGLPVPNASKQAATFRPGVVTSKKR
jgi:hypothetical protein